MMAGARVASVSSNIEMRLQEPGVPERLRQMLNHQISATAEFTMVVRPPRIELGLRVPETLVISLSLRARASFLTLGLRPVNVRAEDR
jgi:hypothetical protein